MGLCIVPKAAPVSRHPWVQGHPNSYVLSSPVSKLAQRFPCQQRKRLGSSAEECPRFSITCALCPGTEPLFQETGATRVTQQPNQVARLCLCHPLPGQGSSAHHTRLPKANSFPACPHEPPAPRLSLTTGTHEAAEVRLGPPLLKEGHFCHLTPGCRFSTVLCFFALS